MPRRARDRVRDRVRDRGVSLVEVLVAVVLLGTAGGAVLMTAAGSATAARVHQEASDVQLVLRSAADAIGGRTPSPCATATAEYQSLARGRLTELGLGPDWPTSRLTVTKVRSFDRASRQFDATCTSDSAPHQVTVSVQPPDGPVVTLQVLTGSGAATVMIGQPHVFTTDWSIISEGDVTLNGTQVYGALAVGGDLRFSQPGPVAANSQGSYGPVLGSASRIGLLVRGRVVLGTATLLVNQSASVVIGNSTGVKYIPNGGVGCVAASSASSCTGAKITLQGSGNAVFGTPFDFTAAFDAYRKASAALATMLPSCAAATAVSLRDQNNSGPWPGNTNFHLRLTPGKVNVWNMTEAQLQSWSAYNNNGSNRPNATTPLVVNVTSADGNVTFNAPNWLQSDAAPYMIWNFPDAQTVTFTGALWGSLYAPNATVTLTGDVRGVVVGKSVVGNGGVADWSLRPVIDIQCPRPA